MTSLVAWSIQRFTSGHARLGLSMTAHNATRGVVKYAGAAWRATRPTRVVAGSVRGWLGERRKALARISGCCYVGLGVLAALSPGSSSSAAELMQ